jgi:uncharacterized protein YndB with AHSA1/START domain
MGYAWETHDQAEVSATVEQVWQAIATGPGIDAWYMGTSSVEPGVGGEVRTTIGGIVMESTVTVWDMPQRFAHRTREADDGRFIALEFLIEGREKNCAVVRFVARGFLPGDDWEGEYHAMTMGWQMFFATLIAYLIHFADRSAVSITVAGPRVSDWPSARAVLGGALGLVGTPTVGDRARFTLEGVGPIDAIVDFVNQQVLGLRSDDALYRFVHGIRGVMVLEHHLFTNDIGQEQASRAWQTWLNRLYV